MRTFYSALLAIWVMMVANTVAANAENTLKDDTGILPNQPATNTVFNGRGNEPGWYVVIDPVKQIKYVGNYGDTFVTLPVPEPTHDAEAHTTTYHATAEGKDLLIVITKVPCQDDMSGKAFGHTVSLTYNGHTYRGCGD